MRIWLKRLLFAILLLTGVYLLGVNLFLNSPLAPKAFNRRPAKFRIAWSAAWTVWPGLVQVRGLRLWGHVNSVTWTVDAERARGWINLGAFPTRTFRVTHLHAEGVRSTVLRGPEQETEEDRKEAAEPETPEDRSYQPWTLRFERITLDHIREFDFNDFRITGDGHGAGSFWVVIRRNFRLDPSQVTMPAAQLAMGNEPIARRIHIEAAASMGPYAPHEHPGLEGFDFLSGTLQARGEVPDLPFLESSGLVKTGHGAPGALIADLRVERGRLAPGSRFDVTAPAADGGSPFAITTAVTRGPQGTLLHLGVDARGLTAGRVAGHPPLFRAATLNVMSTTPETRLSRIFETARDLKDPDKPPIQLPLSSDVRASGVRIEAPGSRATLRATLDHASGRVDLAGLLDRRMVVDGLRADGVSARLSLEKPKPPSGEASPPWTVRIAGGRLTGIREVALDDYLLAGEAQAEATFSYLPDGTLAVQRAALSMPEGRFEAGGETVARSLSVRAEAQVAPAILGKPPGLAFLRYVSGTAGVRASISSLGFLRDYFKKTPWLALQGKGALSADVRLDHGRLVPGSRIAVEASPVQATVFDSRATGRGTVTVAVAQEGAAARTALRVRFNHFVFEDLRQKGWPDYLRGQGLRLSAVTPAALDLTGPLPDFDATLDLPDAEVPDLTVYDALLPREGGLWIVSGRGRARLHLEASTATNRTRGSALLTSDAARVRFQNLEMAGRLALRAPIASPDLADRKLDLKGTHLELTDVSYRNVESKTEAELPGWWARAELSGGSIVWGTPLSLRGEGRVDMQNSGPLLALFAEHSRVLRWLNDALTVENVTARGAVRLGNGAVEIESLQATGGPLEIRTRMDFSKTRRRGDLFVRYGHVAAGIELRDGQRSVKLIHPLEWYEGQQGVWKTPAAR
ncbi:MAG TPA: hypothetical protein VGM86_30780 [Thermoanaerobaculia bacterium]